MPQMFRFEIIGVRKGKEQLADVGKQIKERSVIALERSAELIKAVARGLVRVRKGTLRDAIEVGETELRPGEVSVTVGVFKPPASRYAAFLEWGTGWRGAGSGLPEASAAAREQAGYEYGDTPGSTAYPFLFPASEIVAQMLMPQLVKSLIKSVKVRIR